MGRHVVPTFAQAAAISARIRSARTKKPSTQRTIPYRSEKKPMITAGAPLPDHTSDPPNRVSENGLNFSTFITTQEQ
jgi:hypothetical protein